VKFNSTDVERCGEAGETAPGMMGYKKKNNLEIKTGSAEEVSSWLEKG
jgi:hypothetical protein